MRISRISALFAVTVVLLLAALITKCPHTEDTSSTAKPTAAPTVSQTAASIVSQAASPTVSQNNSAAPKAADRVLEAEFNGYPYSYKKEDTKTVATFRTKFVPPDENAVIGAIRDVIGRSYGDKVDSAPRLAGSGPEQTIRIDGKKHRYIVVPIKEDTGEIYSLIITQLSH